MGRSKNDITRFAKGRTVTTSSSKTEKSSSSSKIKPLASSTVVHSDPPISQSFLDKHLQTYSGMGSHQNKKGYAISMGQSIADERGLSVPSTTVFVNDRHLKSAKKQIKSSTGSTKTIRVRGRVVETPPGKHAKYLGKHSVEISGTDIRPTPRAGNQLGHYNDIKKIRNSLKNSGDTSSDSEDDTGKNYWKHKLTP